MEELPIIVALTGQKGHGKSTAAKAFIDAEFVNHNFADPVRQVATLVYGVTVEEMDDPDLKEQVLDRWPFRSPREIMQTIGTEMFRNYIPETWVECWKAKVLQEEMVVVADLRFPNEAEAIHALEGTIIRVVNPCKPGGGAHISEAGQSLIEADYTVINDGTIAELQRKVRDCMLDAIKDRP